MAKKKGKGKRAAPGKSARRPSSPKPAHPSRPAHPTTVNLRFMNEGKAMATTPKTNPKENPRRRRRRNGKSTFVQALVKVAGATAAMFGSGVVTVVATSKIMPGSKVSLIGIPLAVGGLGAAVATKYPLVGAGIAAGGAAPFVIPVAAQMIQPQLTTAQGLASALRAVSMGGGRQYLSGGYPPHYQARMGAVHMGAVYAD